MTFPFQVDFESFRSSLSCFKNVNTINWTYIKYFSNESLSTFDSIKLADMSSFVIVFGFRADVSLKQTFCMSKPNYDYKFIQFNHT